MSPKTDAEPLSDREVRERSLAGVRDALAALQGVPAAGLDPEKHETLRDMVEDAAALERQLANEVEQMQDSEADSR